MRKTVSERALALVALAALGVWTTGGVAVADPKGDHADHGRHAGQAANHGQGKGTGKGHAHGHGSNHGHGNGNGQGSNHGHGNGHGNSHGNAAGHAQTGQHGQQGHGGQPHGSGASSAPADPKGNNGTVKIAGPGDAVGHPSNNPHPGCTFYVEWFGFDQGRDVVSTVTFASQAPTADVVLGGTSPAQVFVGGDPAGGGTDLDGRQGYTLTFSGGAPHPKQGYHVKLTVHTPHSLGNDSKTKVFWVQPCQDEGDEGTGSGVSPSEAAAPSEGAQGGDGAQAGDSTDQGVLDEVATAPATAGPGSRGSTPASAEVPTAVDAGESGSGVSDWVRSPLPLAVVALGLVLAATGVALRRRSRA
jgi:hypothetical protein